MAPGTPGWLFILAVRPGGSLKIGVTEDIAAMVRDMAEQRARVARSRRSPPPRLVYREKYADFADAIRRCQAMRRWPRRLQVSLIELENAAWRDLSEQA